MHKLQTFQEAPMRRPVRNETAPSDYRLFMIRELLIWLVGVPVPVAAIIGLFVL